MLPFLAPLGKIALQMALRLIGYNFAVEVACIGMSSVAKSTKTDKDDKVFAAIAKAWDVPEAKVKELFK